MRAPMRLDPISPATEARALVRARTLMAHRTPGGSAVTDAAGIDRVAMPVPMPTMSGLFLTNESVDPVGLREAADWFVGRARPWSISVVGAVAPGVEALAGSLGFERHVEPTLVAPLQPDRSRTGSTGTAGAEGDQYRRVQTADDRAVWIRTCDAAFGLPDGTSAPLLTAELLEDDAVRAYLVLHGGSVVGTACTVLDAAGTIGMFCIATLPEVRGRGVGSRLMTFLLDDGAERGATSAYLQSLPRARPFYERVGFVDGHQDVTTFVPTNQPLPA